MMRRITQTFFKGLAVILPVVVTVYVFIWLVRTAESVIRILTKQFIPEAYEFPGMNLILFLLIIFGIGVLMYTWIVRWLLEGVDRVLRAIPIFGKIYGASKDLMNMFQGDVEQQLGQCVLVEIPNTNIRTLGFITRRDLSGLPEGLAYQGHVVVYVQWSSQIGGYCFVVPEEAVTPVEMTVEEGMRWALTAGVSAPTRMPQTLQPPYAADSDKKQNAD
jgi:uncharacterized membrane protein